jgi:ferredoxin-NADP reductase
MWYIREKGFKTAGVMRSEYALRLLRIVEETPETKTFVLERDPRLPEFIPGQFLNVTTDVPEHGRVRRAYSIASSPLDPDIELTIKKFDDGVLSKFLCEHAAAGDVFRVQGPYGVFTLRESPSRLLFVAGGSGIVPFRSMWRYILQRHLDIFTALVYLTRAPELVIYRDEISRLPSARFRVVQFHSRHGDARRSFDKALLERAAGILTDTLCYVCGPPGLCAAVKEWLVELGVAAEDVRVEKYD